MFLPIAHGMAQAPSTIPPSPQKWSTVGNVGNNTDFIGTTNNTSLIFKTNNVKALEIDANADIFIRKLIGVPEGLISHDNGGKIKHIPFNTSFTQVLSSNGVWKEISTFTGLSVNGNDIVQTTTGNFGLGTTLPQAKLDVNGNISATGNIKTDGNLIFAGNKLISFTSSSGNTPSILSFGGPVILPASPGGGGGLPCWFPSMAQVNQFSGMIQSYGTGTGGGLDALNMGFDGANGIIDIAGGQNGMVNRFPRLLINYYCGKDVYMCTGDNGGNIVMAIGAYNGVAIGDEKLPQGYKLAVKGKIIAEELNVKLFGNWPDYVFEKKYELRPISDLEKYLISNKHLPEMPSAKEIETDGINTSEMIAKLLKQQEELTLYIIEQNKRIEELENIK